MYNPLFNLWLIFFPLQNDEHKHNASSFMYWHMNTIKRNVYYILALNVKTTLHHF